LKIQELVSDDEAAKALTFLRDTDEEAARCKAFLDATSENKKIIEAQEFFGSDEKSAEARKQAARISKAYKGWVVDFENATADYLILKNKRDRAFITLELWRSVNSARNKGHV